MTKKINVQKIQERKVIPATILMLIFFVLAFFFMSFVKIPMTPNKHIDMIIKFEEIVKPPEEKPPEEEKQEEQEKEDIKDFDVTQVDETETNPIEEDEVTDEQVDSEQEYDTQEEEEVYEEEEVEEEELEDISLTEVDNTDLNNNLIEDALLGRGGKTSDELDKSDLTDVLRKKKRKKKRTSPNRTLPKRKTGKKKRAHPVNVEEIIEPIILWMEQNPYEFSNAVKIKMNYYENDLTSRGMVDYDGITYVIYLLCKKELKQLAILFTDFKTRECALIKNAGNIKDPNFFETGKIYIKNNRIVALNVKRENVSIDADKYNDILWLWFDKVSKK